ncbi:MAG: hypothetical protein KatS3mg117_2616 [Geminicoccaceae bacterium]|nr:MAG: hypothetical protein KatS3mg117_2616 [Geminicoccaceae bacterium]
MIRSRATRFPALDEPPPAAVDPGPVADAVVFELALFVRVELNVEEVGVVLLESEVFVVELVEHDPEAELPPLARKPQSDFAQFFLIRMSTGLAGRVRFERPTTPSPFERRAASASEVIDTPPKTTAANTTTEVRAIILPPESGLLKVN